MNVFRKSDFFFWNLSHNAPLCSRAVSRQEVAASASAYFAQLEQATECYMLVLDKESRKHTADVGGP